MLVEPSMAESRMRSHPATDRLGYLDRNDSVDVLIRSVRSQHLEGDGRTGLEELFRLAEIFNAVDVDALAAGDDARDNPAFAQIRVVCSAIAINGSDHHAVAGRQREA